MLSVAFIVASLAFDVHGAREDREALAAHHELVDAAQLLLGEVLRRAA